MNTSSSYYTLSSLRYITFDSELLREQESWRSEQHEGDLQQQFLP